MPSMPMLGAMHSTVTGRRPEGDVRSNAPSGRCPVFAWVPQKTGGPLFKSFRKWLEKGIIFQ